MSLKHEPECVCDCVRCASIIANHICAVTEKRMNSMAQRTVLNRNGWIRKRVLSFMGVSDADDVVSAAERHTCCSMCHVDNPSIPYIASCGHCYCYLCLRMAITDDLSFRCLDCGQLVVSSCRSQQ